MRGYRTGEFYEAEQEHPLQRYKGDFNFDYRHLHHHVGAKSACCGCSVVNALPTPPRRYHLFSGIVLPATLLYQNTISPFPYGRSKVRFAPANFLPAAQNSAIRPLPCSSSFAKRWSNCHEYTVSFGPGIVRIGVFYVLKSQLLLSPPWATTRGVLFLL